MAQLRQSSMAAALPAKIVLRQHPAADRGTRHYTLSWEKKLWILIHCDTNIKYLHKHNAVCNLW